MRNSTRHNQGSKNRATSALQARPPPYSASGHGLIPVLAAVLLMVPQARASGDDQGFRIGHEDVVSIRADTAWEDTQPDVVHFEGRFEMHVRDWMVLADRAVLFGKLDDPDRVVLEGSPARMELSYTLGERTEIVHGQASKIVYDREAAQIRLSGDAQMGQGDKMLRSGEINYDISTDRFQTKSETGISIRPDIKNQGVPD